MESQEKKNVIIGTIKGYDFEVLRPFVTTLRKTGYSGEIVFFYSHIDPKTITQLISYGVTLVPFSTEFPYMDEEMASANKWADNARIQNLAVHSLRYLLIYCYLKKNVERYANVLLSDTRDVIFQKNPFDFDMPDTLCCFKERDGFTIADSDINSRWIEQGFGTDELAKIGPMPVICSGVTYGPAERILSYTETMMQTIVDHDIPADMVGMDQGIHNYLIHENKLPAVTLYKNDDGPVLTVGVQDTLKYSNGTIFNARDIAPNVVHQYDRHWHVAKHYYSMRFIVRHHLAEMRGKVSVYARAHFMGLYRLLIGGRNSLLRRKNVSPTIK